MSAEFRMLDIASKTNILTSLKDQCATVFFVIPGEIFSGIVGRVIAANPTKGTCTIKIYSSLPFHPDGFKDNYDKPENQVNYERIRNREMMSETKKQAEMENIKYWYCRARLEKLKGEGIYNPLTLEDNPSQITNTNGKISVEAILDLLGHKASTIQDFENEISRIGLEKIIDIYADRKYAIQEKKSSIEFMIEAEEYIHVMGNYQRFCNIRRDIILKTEEVIDLTVLEFNGYRIKDKDAAIRKIMLRNVPIGTYIAWWVKGPSISIRNMIQGELVRTNFDADEITLRSWINDKESTHNIKEDMDDLQVRNGPGATSAVEAKDYTRDIGTYYSKRPEEQHILYEAVRSSLYSAIGTVSSAQGNLQLATGGTKISEYVIDEFVGSQMPDDD